MNARSWCWTDLASQLAPALSSSRAASSGKPPVMMRILVVAIFGAMLASCSGTNRFEDIVPGGATTPPGGRPTQYAAPKNHSEGRGTRGGKPRGTPGAEPQGAKKPEGQSPAEE